MERKGVRARGSGGQANTKPIGVMVTIVMFVRAMKLELVNGGGILADVGNIDV